MLEKVESFSSLVLTSVCCISNVFPITGTDEELDLGKERLKVRDVWHGELHKSGRRKHEFQFKQREWGDTGFSNCDDKNDNWLLHYLVHFHVQFFHMQSAQSTLRFKMQK